jgi:hypothetical protein
MNGAPRDYDKQQAHVHPAEQTKLLLQVTLLEGHDETHETYSVQRKADDPMICRKRKEASFCEHNMLSGA